jgi:transcriptional regulator with XRE-family HTH domain
LRQRREKLRVSQEAFADMCGLDRTYVGGIERGERNVALVNIEKIAKALRIPVSELFRGV